MSFISEGIKKLQTDLGSIFMTAKEFYASIGGDYEDIVHRLPTDEMIIRFVRRFTTDGTYKELTAAVENGDISASFEAAHKLKGIAANLAFTDLYRAVSALAEQLRPQNRQADVTLMQRVAECYQAVLDLQKHLEDGGAG